MVMLAHLGHRDPMTHTPHIAEDTPQLERACHAGAAPSRFDAGRW